MVSVLYWRMGRPELKMFENEKASETDKEVMDLIDHINDGYGALVWVHVFGLTEKGQINTCLNPSLVNRWRYDWGGEVSLYSFAAEHNNIGPRIGGD